MQKAIYKCKEVHSFSTYTQHAQKVTDNILISMFHGHISLLQSEERTSVLSSDSALVHNFFSFQTHTAFV
jgi:hypothetical protein